MEGFAKLLFAEKKGDNITHPSPHKWNNIQLMLAMQVFSYIDYALAQRLLQSCSNACESIALFICYLSAAARQGHLCIFINGQNLSPALMEISLSNKRMSEKGNLLQPLAPNIIETIGMLIIQGARNLPSHIVTDMRSSKGIPVTPICRYENGYYLQKNWVYESTFIEKWQKLINDQPTLLLNQASIQKNLNNLISQGKVLPEQAEAIMSSSQQCLSLIVGGPGTGKTYTAGQMVRIFWEEMDPQQQKQCEFALAAPTGKAAANLKTSLKQAFSCISCQMPEPKTLHTLLGQRLNASQTETLSMLSADIIIVDESSMIDVRLMAQLFSSIKPGARLILLGDKHQLPPVEAGSPFADLIKFYAFKTKNLSVVELKTCLRTDLLDILNFSQAINQGNVAFVLKMLSTESNLQGIRRLVCQEPEENVIANHQFLLQKTKNLFPNDEALIERPLDLLDAFNLFRILSPLRKGPYGVEAINKLFLEHTLSIMRFKNKIYIPIMIVRNDKQSGLSNGEVGILICQNKSYDILQGHFQEKDMAIFPGEPLRIFTALHLPPHQVAYCLSVHKSQGSEFQRVLLLNPKGSEYFGREILYTAATRARQHLDIWGSTDTLEAVLARQSSRLSGFSLRINQTF